MNRKATRLLVSAIGTKTWRANHPIGFTRTEGCPSLLSPALLDFEPCPETGRGWAKPVLKVHAGSRWTRIEDHY